MVHNPALCSHSQRFHSNTITYISLRSLQIGSGWTWQCSLCLHILEYKKKHTPAGPWCSDVRAKNKRKIWITLFTEVHQSLKYMVNPLVGKRDTAKSKVKHGISRVETIHKRKWTEYEKIKLFSLFYCKYLFSHHWKYIISLSNSTPVSPSHSMSFKVWRHSVLLVVDTETLFRGEQKYKVLCSYQTQHSAQ